MADLHILKANSVNDREFIDLVFHVPTPTPSGTNVAGFSRLESP